VKGFSTPLTVAEIEVLLSFGDKESIAYPADCSVSKADVAVALVSLKERGLVCNKAPYRLTKRGKEILGELFSRDCNS
jgi:hypothetical protein